LADRHWSVSDIILPIRSESGERSPLNIGTIIAVHTAAGNRHPEDGERLARFRLTQGRRGEAMARPVFYGWKIVIVCFLIALFGFGIGFYGPGIYIVSLQARHGWSTSLISSAITAYYLLSGILIIFTGDAFDRYGPRCVVLLGMVAMVAGVAGLMVITAPWQLYVTFLVMSVGWASMSGAAINTIIAPWFEHRRGLAVSVALNGGSCGGVLIVPLLMWLIAHVGFAPAVSIALATMLVVLVPSVVTVLRRTPDELGLLPDGEPPPAHEPLETRLRPAPRTSSRRRAAALRQVHFWTISIPFALGLAAQVGFLTHQIAYLEPRLGHHGAGVAVSLTTVAAIMGRLLTGVFIDRFDRRLVASVNFLIQAIALGIMTAWSIELALYLACVGVGLTVGNMTSLSALIVHQEFPKERFGTVISLIVAFNQLTFAFGPSVLGVIRDVTHSYTPSLLLCIFVHSLAAGIVLLRYGITAPAPLPSLASTRVLDRRGRKPT
jgi:MFS family permease